MISKVNELFYKALAKNLIYTQNAITQSYIGLAIDRFVIQTINDFYISVPIGTTADRLTECELRLATV